MDERFIIPERLVAQRFADGADMPRWDAAVICFRDIEGSQSIVNALGGRPVNRKMFWGIEETGGRPRVYSAVVNGKRVGIVTRCLWGGPQAAILVEELAVFGVKYVIGCGAAGSLDAALDRGEQLAVTSAVATDGTSRMYGAGPFAAAEEMLALVPSASHVVAATVDAPYRETPKLVAEWKRLGAQVINMEAAPFYAAASVCGLRALWIGHVSDVLVSEWRDWHVDRTVMNGETAANCLAVLHGLAMLPRRVAP